MPVLSAGGQPYPGPVLTPVDFRLRDSSGAYPREAQVGLYDGFRLLRLHTASFTEKQQPYGAQAQLLPDPAQLEALCPGLIYSRQAFVPGIYAFSRQLQYLSRGRVSITLPKPHGLAAGDIVRIRDRNGNTKDLAVLEAPDSSSLVVYDALPRARDYFVYGKQVADLRELDAAALCVVLCAVQQQSIAETDSLKRQLADCRRQLEALGGAFRDFREQYQLLYHSSKASGHRQP